MNYENAPTLETPRGYLIRLYVVNGCFDLDRQSPETCPYIVMTNDSDYQELLGGKPGFYYGCVTGLSRAIEYINEFGRKHGLTRWETVSAYKAAKNYRGV